MGEEGLERVLLRAQNRCFAQLDAQIPAHNKKIHAQPACPL